MEEIDALKSHKLHQSSKWSSAAFDEYNGLAAKVASKVVYSSTIRELYQTIKTETNS